MTSIIFIEKKIKKEVFQNTSVFIFPLSLPLSPFGCARSRTQDLMISAKGLNHCLRQVIGVNEAHVYLFGLTFQKLRTHGHVSAIECFGMFFGFWIVIISFFSLKIQNTCTFFSMKRFIWHVSACTIWYDFIQSTFFLISDSHVSV